MVFLPNRWQLCFFERSVTFFKEMVLLSNIKASWASWRGKNIWLAQKQPPACKWQQLFCWSGCSERKTALLWRTSFLQSIVCWECSTGIQLNRLYITYIYIYIHIYISLWAMKAIEKKLHCLILFAILPLAQCVAFSLVNWCAAHDLNLSADFFCILC